MPTEPIACIAWSVFRFREIRSVLLNHDPKIREFHNIMPISNMSSVLEHGILSHERAKKVSHQDVSLSVIQARRQRVTLPDGLPLHQYANLYFHARNPMLYRLQGKFGRMYLYPKSKNGVI